jgi:hypothetical protein
MMIVPFTTTPNTPQPIQTPKDAYILMAMAQMARDSQTKLNPQDKPIRG